MPFNFDEGEFDEFLEQVIKLGLFDKSKQNDDESQIVFNTFDRIQMVVLQS